jgi:hypothetical protein
MQVLLAATCAALLAGALLAAVPRPHRCNVAVSGALAAAAGVAAWSNILLATQGNSAFTDVPPVFAFPVVWGDLGSGVFALVLAWLVFSLGPLRNAPACRVVPPSLITALSALLVFIYLFLA